MTNELEKRFFDTFGIPRLCTSQVCEHWGDCEGCLIYPDFALDYPQITDRILLELICILNKFTGYTSLLKDAYEEVKEEILKNVLFAHEQLRINKAELSKQVRTLFEEG